MHEKSVYDYAIIRVLPKVDRGEFINVGVILSCPDQDFLQAHIVFDEKRLLALDPTADIDTIREHLAAISTICAGGADAGPIGQLTKRERFHWLVAPRSTVIQTSSVHTGYCTDPVRVLEHLVDTMVRPASDRFD